MKTLLLLFALLLTVGGFAQKTPTLVHLVNPSSVSTPHGYSHAALIELGNSTMVILSGQVALDAGATL